MTRRVLGTRWFAVVLTAVVVGVASLVGYLAVDRRDDSDSVVVADARSRAAPDDEPSTSSCGPPPVFRADERSDDPDNVDGTPGPGPDGEPAAPGQVVAHWTGDFDVVVELRWPADAAPNDDAGFAVETVGGFRGTEVETADGWEVVLDLGGDDGACSRLGIVSRGPVTAAAADGLAHFLDTLRPRAELATYLEAIERSSTVAARPPDVEPGQCSDPIAADLDEFGAPTDATVAALLSRFFADRIGARGAYECLSPSGLAAFDGDGLCLFACDDGPIGLEAHGPFEPEGFGDGGTLASAVVTYPAGSRVREHYGITVVDTPSGERLVISTVRAGPESFVDDAEARALISTFLGSLDAGEYEAAAALLVNEGIGQQIHDEFGDAAYEPGSLPTLLADYCETAYCHESFEVLEQTHSTELSRTYHVLFVDSPAGVYSATFSVATFEGRLTVDGLPPNLG